LGRPYLCFNKTTGISAVKITERQYENHLSADGGQLALLLVAKADQPPVRPMPERRRIIHPLFYTIKKP
jgi:hypothetical protein